MDSKITVKQKSFFDIKKDINLLAFNYPFLNLKTLSRSTLGREIFALQIGSAKEYIYFLPSFCGNEIFLNILLLKFLEELSYALYNGTEIAGVNIRKAIGGKGIIFLPLINPDGHEIAVKGFSAASYLCDTVNQKADCPNTAFKYNLRGVYLENNFFKSAVGTPFKNNFGGYSPFSESESLCIAEALRKNPPRHIVSFSENNDCIEVYSKANDIRTQKMTEVINAVCYKKINFQKDGHSFYNWVNHEFSVPCFKIGLKGIDENNLNNYYTALKELLVLMLIM